MSDHDRFYVTTPIYYVNDVPHLGHAYTTVAADAFARFYQLRGRETRFLTGTDEHGLKIGREAEKAGTTPQAFVDRVSAAFREAWPRLNCEPSDFLRTTEPRHRAAVQELWKKCEANGDIYLGNFEGLYCVSCEQYYTEKELLEGGLCPVHKKPVERMAEHSYMFRLSKYAERLVALYEREPTRVLPDTRRNEVLSFLRGGLKDLSVSRTTFSWGVPVPGDPKHVMYVWFDALANYLSALDTPALRERFWPPDAQLVGKDILRFHTVYWPAFLMSAGYSEEQLPRTVFSHGFLTVNGEKMSKSVRESVVPPQRLVEAFGPDEVRYYLLREIAFGQDGDFAIKTVVHRIRAELSGTVGNLLNRALPFVVKHFDGKLPDPSAAPHELDAALRARTSELVAEAARAWEGFEPHRGLELAITLAMAGNKYFDDTAPWTLAKDPSKRERLGAVLYHVLEVVRAVGLLLYPALPTKMNALRAQLGLPPVTPELGTDRWPFEWGGLAPGAAVAPGAPLFRNWSRDDEARVLQEFHVVSEEKPATKSEAKPEAKSEASADAKPEATAAAAAPASEAPSEAGANLIAFDDFAKVALKLGTVLTAERIPKKDMLLRLTLELGEPAPRTIIAGIAKAYAPEQLVGKQLVVVANLAPRDFGKGLVSHGMLLACGPKESLSIVTVERPQAAGTPVK